jgi:hypothetical protein
VPTIRSQIAFARGACGGILMILMLGGEPQRLGPAGQIEREVAGLLGHPVTRRVGGHPGQVHPPVGDLHEDQHVQPAQQHRLHGDQVAADDAAGLRGENRRQLGPSRRGAGSMPARCRIDHTVLAATR